MYIFAILIIFGAGEIVKIVSLSRRSRGFYEYVAATGYGLILFGATALVGIFMVTFGISIDLFSVVVEESCKALLILSICRGDLSKWCILSFALWELMIGKGILTYGSSDDVLRTTVNNSLPSFVILSSLPVLMHLATERLYKLTKVAATAFIASCALHYSFNYVAVLLVSSGKPTTWQVLLFSASVVIVYSIVYVKGLRTDWR